jgi:adenylate cyclase
VTTASDPGVVAFTDIVGFTQFTAEQGDAAALSLLDRQDHIARETLPAGARVVKMLGDGLLLWLPEAVAALEAALVLSQRFEEEAATEVPLWVRIGMHWGCPTRRGDDLVGHDVNLAARIAGVAGPGEVLVSETVRARVDGRIDGLRFEELGPVVMKGIPAPTPLFRATRTA